MKQAIILSVIVLGAVLTSIGSHAWSPLAYMIFPSLVTFWVVAQEKRLLVERGLPKKLPWGKKVKYWFVYPLLSVVGGLFTSSDVHALVSPIVFWIFVSFIDGLFIVLLYQSYVRSRNRFGVIRGE